MRIERDEIFYQVFFIVFQYAFAGDVDPLASSGAEKSDCRKIARADRAIPARRARRDAA
ncbi:hypothetical protein C7S16_5876 [Burkholderia thailandensis]|uniref:Uncharacterized protein n=1 Tax=Burkholderia thailandensis TaxID=57975 RepID=A0AAW9CMC3_BURTH|nr:hypothetical protein [Burkholderia thailandensis]